MGWPCIEAVYGGMHTLAVLIASLDREIIYSLMDRVVGAEDGLVDVPITRADYGAQANATMKHAITMADFFSRYPLLQTFLLHELRQAAGIVLLSDCN